jgi:putative effector of murein hydrolase LrgA (UPF0299 family)
MIVIGTAVIVAAVIVRRVLGQGFGRHPKLKYFFNYNLVIVITSMFYLPLCVSIVEDFDDLKQGGTPIGALMIINHIMSGLSAVGIWVYLFFVYKVLNRKD